MPNVAVIGGGAAGMTAALFAAEAGAHVTLLEKNTLLGRKLGITGKGRCNVTNNCSSDEFMKALTANGKFMYSAINRFSPADTVSLFERLGVPLKTERGNRVFPVSDKATDVVLALKKQLISLGVDIRHARVTDIRAEAGRIVSLKTDAGIFSDFDSVILATGGLSYPVTGSTGDGYAFAKKVGHTVTEIIPSLVGLTSNDPACGQMQGLALKNVAVSVMDGKTGKIIYKDFGEMLFTHFGISGPMILSASAHMRPMEQGRYSVRIDLKPALDEATLDKRLLSDFEKYKNRDFANALGDLLPAKMIPVFIEKSGLSPTEKVNSVSKEKRKAVLTLLKCFPIPVSGFRPIEEAIVTSGGVSVSEVYPATMKSKLCNNLYFAGEILDLDAYTGGFNLQIAFSTAFAAANAAASQE